MQELTALIVDDDNDFRTLFSEVLQEEGYRVLEAANGRDAIALLDWERPDVMLIDLVMPVMNGWALFDMLEKRPELSGIPVVFLSAVPQMAPGGGSLIVGKPLKLSNLTALLEALRPAPRSGEIPIMTSPRTSPDYRLNRSRA